MISDKIFIDVDIEIIHLKPQGLKNTTTNNIINNLFSANKSIFTITALMSLTFQDSTAHAQKQTNIQKQPRANVWYDFDSNRYYIFDDKNGKQYRCQENGEFYKQFDASVTGRATYAERARLAQQINPGWAAKVPPSLRFDESGAFYAPQSDHFDGYAQFPNPRTQPYFNTYQQQKIELEPRRQRLVEEFQARPSLVAAKNENLFQAYSGFRAYSTGPSYLTGTLYDKSLSLKEKKVRILRARSTFTQSKGLSTFTNFADKKVLTKDQNGKSQNSIKSKEVQQVDLPCVKVINDRELKAPFDQALITKQAQRDRSSQSLFSGFRETIFSQMGTQHSKNSSFLPRRSISNSQKSTQNSQFYAKNEQQQQNSEERVHIRRYNEKVASTQSVFDRTMRQLSGDVQMRSITEGSPSPKAADNDQQKVQENLIQTSPTSKKKFTQSIGLKRLQARLREGRYRQLIPTQLQVLQNDRKLIGINFPEFIRAPDAPHVVDMERRRRELLKGVQQDQLREMVANENDIIRKTLLNRMRPVQE